MKQGVKLFVILIGIASILWGISLIFLGFYGISTPAQNVHTRRILGQRNETIPNQYTYSIAYEFITHDGKLISGHTQSIGNSYSVKTPRHITYLKSYPQLNAPQENTGISSFPITLLGIGTLILWVTCRGSSKIPRGAVQARKSTYHISKKQTIRRPATQSLDANEWLRKYRNDSRRYAWLFFTGMVIVIGIMVRLGLDDWSQDWLYATGFAAFVMWILAIFSRREAESSWQGVVSSKEVIQVKNATRTSYLIHVKTNTGKHKKIRVTPGLFDFYHKGSQVRKLAGLSFPITDDLDKTTAFCPVCGNLLKGATDQCPSCRAPVYNWAGQS